MRGWWMALVVTACSHTSSTPAPETPAEHVPAEKAQRPETKRTVVTSTDIELLDPIGFLPTTDAIEPRSIHTLDAIAQTLVANKNIVLLEVQAFAPDALADVRGRLAADRARVIVDELVARGVARNRLTPGGYDKLPAGNPKGAPLFVVLRWAN